MNVKWGCWGWFLGGLYFGDVVCFELHPKSWTQNFWSALCIDITQLKKG